MILILTLKFTKINCATNSYAQNMAGFQLLGQIYYQDTQDIFNGAELRRTGSSK